MSISEPILRSRLDERLSKITDILTDEQVLAMYQLLNQINPASDDFSDFEQMKDEHFRLNYENLDLSYTDMFKNFLLSRSLFDDFFLKTDRDAFTAFFKNGQYQEAIDLYVSIADGIAKEKWLPKHFARKQALDIL